MIVSEDPAFGALLAEAGSETPSFVLIRRAEPLSPEERASLLTANLLGVAEMLERGAIVVLARGRVRVRPLPVRGTD